MKLELIVWIPAGNVEGVDLFKLRLAISQLLSYNVFMNDGEIVCEFKVRVQRIIPDAEIYFYGSRVKKNHSKDSDFDVLVVTKRFSPKTREKISGLPGK